MEFSIKTSPKDFKELEENEFHWGNKLKCCRLNEILTLVNINNKDNFLTTGGISIPIDENKEYKQEVPF